MTELPIGWEIKRLDAIAEIVMGQSPPGSSYNEIGQGKPFFQGKTEFGDVHPTVRKYTTAGTKFAKAGDILMSVRAPVGPTNLADIDCVIGRGLAAIRAKPIVTQSYLRWVLKHLEIDIQSKGTGTTFDAITGETLRGTLVAVPTIDEQHKIVELLEDHLSRLDAALVDLRQAKIKAAQFRRSLLQSTFLKNLATNTNRASSITFDDAFEIGKMGRNAVKQRDYLHDGKFPVIDQGEDFISGYSNEKSLVLDFKKPVIIFGDHTRRIKYVNFPFIPGADGTKILVPNVELDSAFACYQLQSKELRDKGYARHFSELRKEKFWIPPMNEQLKIVERLDEHFSRLKTTAALADALEKQATGLRRSLLQATFTGKLTIEVVSV